jgi:hypothetical protein
LEIEGDVVSVISEADNTPKQTYNVSCYTEAFIDLLESSQQFLLFREAAVHGVLDGVDVALHTGVEDVGKLQALQNVLTKKGLAWL